MSLSEGSEMRGKGFFWNEALKAVMALIVGLAGGVYLQDRQNTAELESARKRAEQSRLDIHGLQEKCKELTMQLYDPTTTAGRALRDKGYAESRVEQLELQVNG